MFLESLLVYVVKMILIVGLAVAGWFIGAALRKRKDKRDALLASESNNQED
ncbi:MAG: hypothetical protein IJC76_07110 [Lachnospiraceae bacterium]|nr:hypothetical protein [Lachnospiraceae bacterium]